MIMESFSPLAQRVIAAMLALLALLLALQVIILPLFGAVGAERQALADARFRLAQMEAVVAGPPPPRPEPGLKAQLVVAPDQQQAAARLAARLSAGARQRALIIRATPVSLARDTAGRAVLVQVEASGSADMLLAWIAEAESGTPLIRFDQLNFEAGEAGPARVAGIARAVWMHGR